MAELTEDYKEYLYERLEDPAEAAEYLNAALEDEDVRVFLLALKDVTDVIGVTKVARAADLNRENLYKILSDQGNPRLSSMLGILRALGIQLQVKPLKVARKRGRVAADIQPSLFEQPPSIKEPRIAGGYSEYQEFENGSTDNTKNESVAA